jgi:hypothetical protein
MLGWVQVEIDDVLLLFDEPGIAARFEGCHQVRLSLWARQMRRTLASLMPAAAAMVRVDQCVALPGF